MIFAGLVNDQVKLTNYVLMDSTDKKEFGHFAELVYNIHGTNLVTI
jgi:hypothetical protein